MYWEYQNEMYLTHEYTFLFVCLPHLSEENNIFSSLIHEFKHQGHNVLVSSRDQNERNALKL